MDESFTKKLSDELPVFWELIPIRDWLTTLRSLQDYLGKTIDDPEDTHLILESRIKRISNLNQSMELVSEILRNYLVNQRNNSDETSFEQIRNVIKFHQLELDRRHPNLEESQWPKMLKPELISRWLLLDKTSQRWLNIDSVTDEHRAAITILPILLAIYCSKHSAPENWLGDSVSIFKINRLKAFDEAWFNEAFYIVLAYLSQNLTNLSC